MNFFNKCFIFDRFYFKKKNIKILPNKIFTFYKVFYFYGFYFKCIYLF